MADLEQQVMQLTQDLYVLKHTTIAGKTVEEWIIESNTVPEDAMITRGHLQLVRRVKQLEKENKKLKETIKDHQFYEEKLEHRIIEFEELLHGE